MGDTQTVRFRGVPGSPYTRKMLAYLRYRHIPYELLIGDQARLQGLPEPKVHLLPTFYLPDADGNLQAVVDSTPLIRRFEAEYAGRSALPEDPALSFINDLIEDYADEWLTKAMFHYRWHYAADIDFAGTILPHWSNIQASRKQLATLKAVFSERQIARLYVVGSNDLTAPVIEASYGRLLGILDRIIEDQGFMLGARPSASDFALYAQLTQLAKFDPTPAARCIADAPRVFAWVDLLDDLSGHPAERDAWLSADALPETVTALLAEIGRTYVPALLANAKAIAAGEDQMRTQIDGEPWEQPVFPYQAKCLQWIRGAYDGLSPKDQQRVDARLSGTGCEAMLSQAKA